MRVYNFSAGPSMLPLEVLEKVQGEFLNYDNTGMSVTEMSHRSKPFMAIASEAESNLRKLLNVPSEYAIIFVQGGASTQFEAVPLNLLNNHKSADYVVTGNFSKKAFSEAKKFGDIEKIASSEDKNFTYIPDLTKVKYRDKIDYVHMCSNNTIFGTKATTLPKTKAPIVCDMSSNILSEKINVSDYGVIYAGAQKNIAPAGATIVIVRKDLLGKEMEHCPTMLKWKTQVDESSLYNTPPAFSIYVANEVFKWLLNLGGVEAMQKINEDKAKMLYDFIDNSKLFSNPVVKNDRSIMNVPFVTTSADLDDKFVKEATTAGLTTLKGHRLVGGMRASIYNAMPVDGIKKLVEFMAKFEKENG